MAYLSFSKYLTLDLRKYVFITLRSHLLMRQRNSLNSDEYRVWMHIIKNDPLGHKTTLFWKRVLHTTLPLIFEFYRRVTTPPRRSAKVVFILVQNEFYSFVFSKLKACHFACCVFDRSVTRIAPTVCQKATGIKYPAEQVNLRRRSPDQTTDSHINYIISHLGEPISTFD